MTEGTFSVRDEVDEPGIVGASWWQDGLDPIGRRPFLKGLLVGGGILAGVGAVGSAIHAAVAPTNEVQTRRSLDIQREYGWSFGAEGEPLVFDGQSTQPFDRSALDRLGADLRPRSPGVVPFFVPTLFESIGAIPNKKTEDAWKAVPLRDALRPISTPAMDVAYRRGQTAAATLAGRSDVALLADLPGPEAVAFAAGASSVLEPVCLFDNWPHPRGVVPAHLTLAALAYYQPLFAKNDDVRKAGAPVLFVLDRKRLAPYADDATQFDNRHLARLPTASAFAERGIKWLVYVPPGSNDVELDDLNDDFVDLGAKDALRLVAAPSFDMPVDVPPGDPYPTAKYAPKPRTTPFSSGRPGGARPLPAGFATVPVIVAIGTGVVLGAKFTRNGSLWRGTSGGG